MKQKIKNKKIKKEKKESPENITTMKNNQTGQNLKGRQKPTKQEELEKTKKL